MASVAKKFVCIADGSKLVDTLGKFTLPVEVIPMARALVMRQLAALGGQSRLRTEPGSDQAFITDNGYELIDVVEFVSDDGDCPGIRRQHVLLRFALGD